MISLKVSVLRLLPCQNSGPLYTKFGESYLGEMFTLVLQKRDELAKFSGRIRSV